MMSIPPPREIVSAFDHVMIDIETLSLHPHKALILSVGMIEFDPSDPKRLRYNPETKIYTPYIGPQLLLGRRVDASTQEFWRSQPEAARRHWEYPAVACTAEAMLNVIRAFCAGKAVWANGTQFDLSNLKGLAEDIGYGQELWHYQAPRDMRTFTRTTRPRREPPLGDALDIPGVPHEPVYDCIAQAWRVWSHWDAE